MIEKLLTFAIFVTVGWLLLVAMLSLQEKSLIFLPSKTLSRTPRDLGLRTVLDIKLPTASRRSPFSPVSRAWHTAR